VPGALGAVTLKLKVLLPPRLTFADRLTLLVPQVLLFAGFCEPSRNLEVDQAVLPLFCIVTETL